MLNFVFAFVLAGVSLCVSGDYFIEIVPHNEAKPYVMKLNETILFKAEAYRKADTVDSKENIDGKVLWKYDKRFLEKVSSNEISINLKAVKEGASQLSAICFVTNSQCQKEIDISITK